MPAKARLESKLSKQTQLFGHKVKEGPKKKAGKGKNSDEAAKFTAKDFTVLVKNVSSGLAEAKHEQDYPVVRTFFSAACRWLETPTAEANPVIGDAILKIIKSVFPPAAKPPYDDYITEYSLNCLSQAVEDGRLEKDVVGEQMISCLFDILRTGDCSTARRLQILSTLIQLLTKSNKNKALINADAFLPRLKALAALMRQAGDVESQISIMQILFRLLPKSSAGRVNFAHALGLPERLAEICGDHFHEDVRSFLKLINSGNDGLSKCPVFYKVREIHCLITGHLAPTKLKIPEGLDTFWLDFDVDGISTEVADPDEGETISLHISYEKLSDWRIEEEPGGYKLFLALKEPVIIAGPDGSQQDDPPTTNKLTVLIEDDPAASAIDESVGRILKGRDVPEARVKWSVPQMERPPLRVEKARVAADVTMEKTPAELAADEVPPSTPKAVAKSFVSESSFTFSSSSSAQTPEPMKAKVVLDWEVEIEPVAKSGRVLVSAKKPVQSAEPVTPAKLVSAMRTVSAKKIVQLPDDAAPRDSAVAIRKNTKEGRIKPISLKSDSSSSGSDICEHDETLVAPNSDKAVSAKKGGLQWALEQYRAKKKLSDQSHGTSAIKTPSKPMVMTDLFDRRERSTGRRDPDETMLISASPFITPGAKERKSLLERVRTERQTVDETFTEKGKSSAKRGRKALEVDDECGSELEMPGASNTETDEEYNPGKRRKLAIKNTKALSSAVKQPRLAIEDVAASVKRFTSSIKKRGPASSTKAKDRAVTLESLARQFLPSSDEEFESDEEQPQPTRTPSRAVSTRPVSSRRVPRYEEIGAYISPQVPQPHVPHPVEAGHVIMEIPTGDTTNVDIKGVSDIFGEIGQIYEAKLRSKAIYIDQKLARALSRMTKDITLVNEAVFAGEERVKAHNEYIQAAAEDLKKGIQKISNAMEKTQLASMALLDSALETPDVLSDDGAASSAEESASDDESVDHRSHRKRTKLS